MQLNSGMATTLASTVKAVAESTSNAYGPDPVSGPRGDLDNPIHPLFSHANFRVEEDTTKDGVDYPTSLTEISATAYEALTPALRLAPLLITVPSVLSLFDPLCNSKAVGERSEKGRADIARGPWEGEPLGLEAVKDTFNFMKTRVQFQFVQPDACGAIGRTVFARLYDDLVAQTEAKSIERGILAGDRFSFHRMCEGQAYVGLCRSRWLRSFEQEMTRDRSAYQLNALLDFAHTLMHEVVHAFFLFVDTEFLHGSDLLRVEPWYNERSEPELGWTY
ncbi:hypothetical protein BDU57DRAFT_163560 [Ampelomyces quisqualis]|uniref:Uncharacterized protein n=1 Tax=Ampelomyces quisqualis TaxID=50730 RepID=A0A6A5QS40_AMPQU|nr:hypothetical protein BDU57DRAFT_163560 [Ampelomyces quisqualis]